MTDIATPVMNETDARILTLRIRRGIDEVDAALTEAIIGRVDAAMGYDSLTDWWINEVGSARLSGEVRDMWIRQIKADRPDMGVRAIASAVGVSRETVRRELSPDTNVSPQTPGPVDKASPVDPGTNNRPTDSGLPLAPRAGEERPVAKAAAESTDGLVATTPSPEVATSSHSAARLAVLDGELDAAMEGTASRFRRNFSSAIARADDVWQFDPDRIAEVYAGDFAQAIRPFLDEMTQWCERVAAAQRRGSGLRVVSGGAR